MDFIKNKPLTIIYHADCIDGLASAWAVALACGDDRQLAMTYLPYGHHDTAACEARIRQSITADTTVCFVDVAPTPAFLEELIASDAPQVVILDHHASAAEALQDSPQSDKLTLDIDPHHPSAASMIWQKILPQAKQPCFIKQLEKMDLGHLETPDDYAAAALIDSYDISSIAHAFASFRAMDGMALTEMIALGHHILADQQARLRKLTDNTMYASVSLAPKTAAIRIPVINADVQNFGRQISSYLVKIGEDAGAGIAFAWYVNGNGAVTMSLRSNGTPDAQLIAQHLCQTFGVTGGGHKTSAAIHFPSLAAFIEALPLTS